LDYGIGPTAGTVVIRDSSGNISSGTF
jgi:hypothetical protein